MSKPTKELITCNRCRHSWKASTAQGCPECESYNIEIGTGRDPDWTPFKPGDWVRFLGLKYAGKSFAPYYGKLRAQVNAAVGCVKIVDEPIGLIFNADGTLYCHAHLGVLLEKAKPVKSMKPKKEVKS